LPDGRWYESASRFNSQIPLEYAYGAWRKLPEGDDVRRLLDPFRVSREQLLLFARARLYALQQIEDSFQMKNKFAPKARLSLPRRDDAHKAIRLPDVLLEFLYVEHHTKLQSLLALFALPFERRVASGSSLLLEALEDCSGGPCRLRIRFDLAG